MKQINCPTCGYPNPINLETCTFCQASLKEALLKDPDLIPCPTCLGTGEVRLDYKGNYARILGINGCPVLLAGVLAGGHYQI